MDMWTDTGKRLQTANIPLLNITIAGPLDDQHFAPLLKKHDGDTPSSYTTIIISKSNNNDDNVTKSPHAFKTNRSFCIA